jgi:hypothetical protein
MPNVLTAADSVTCPDSGIVTTPTSPKLTVGGSAVRLRDPTSGWSIAACTQTTGNDIPCTKLVAVSDGAAAKLRVGGAPVLLQTLAATSNGAPKNQVSAATGQPKLRAS